MDTYQVFFLLNLWSIKPKIVPGIFGDIPSIWVYTRSLKRQIHEIIYIYSINSISGMEAAWLRINIQFWNKPKRNKPKLCIWKPCQKQAYGGGKFENTIIEILFGWVGELNPRATWRVINLHNFGLIQVIQTTYQN